MTNPADKPRQRMAEDTGRTSDPWHPEEGAREAGQRSTTCSLLGRGLERTDRYVLEVDDRVLVVILQADVAGLGPRPARRITFAVLLGAVGLEVARVEIRGLHAVDRRDDAVALERDLQGVPLAGL